MTEVLTADAAALELLDHVGEEVAIEIMLPGGVPWAGGSGVLSHTGRQLMEMASGSNEMFYFSEEERDEGRSTAERLLRQEDYAGEFMVDGFASSISVISATTEPPLEQSEICWGLYIK